MRLPEKPQSQITEETELLRSKICAENSETLKDQTKSCLWRILRDGKHDEPVSDQEFVCVCVYI